MQGRRDEFKKDSGKIFKRLRQELDSDDEGDDKEHVGITSSTGEDEDRILSEKATPAKFDKN